MEDTCQKPDELSTADIFKNTQDLMKAMGADQKCVKAADTWGRTNSASANFYARGSVGWGAAEAETGGGFQVSSTAFGNAMSESGCGTYVVNATKQATNIKKIQCTIQKSQNTSEVGVSGTNTITFRTTALTPDEVKEKAKLLGEVNTNYTSNIPRPTIKDYSDLLTLKVLTPQEALTLLNEDQKNWSDSRSALINNITKSYSRDINFKNGSITQSINGKIKILNSLSANETQTIENAMKEISRAVAEQQVEQTSGVNASTPNSRSVVDVNIQKNENLSSTAINSKVQSIKQNIGLSNNLTVDIAGNINFENVNINQSIVLDVVAESLIASAISAGVKAATEIVTDTSTMNKLKTESKGLEDLVKAQGEANAAAINAGKVGPIGAPALSGSFMMILIVIGGLYALNNSPVLKYTMIALVFLFILIVLLNLSAFMYKIREYTGTFTKEDKMNLMKRSVDYYNIIWSSFGCTYVLTYDDIMTLGFEDIPSPLLNNAMEQIFKKSLLDNAKQNDIKLCFADGKVPQLFLPKIRMKRPQDLTVPELRQIWTTVSNCSSTYFQAFIDQWNRDLAIYNADKTKPFKYLTFSDVAVEVDKCGLEQIKLKAPRDLTDEDLKILWIKYGICDEKKFSNFVGQGKYKTLPDMTAVLNAIQQCDSYSPSQQSTAATR